LKGQKQYCKHVFALLAALDAIGHHSTDKVFPLKFRRKGLGNHDKSTPTHFFEKDATNLSWPEVIEGLFSAVDKKRKYVQGYNKFQSEIPLTKKQKKEVESAKAVEEQIYSKMTVADLRKELKESFEVVPKSDVRKPELIELAVTEFRKAKSNSATSLSSPSPSPQLSQAPQQQKLPQSAALTQQLLPRYPLYSQFRSQQFYESLLSYAQLPAPQYPPPPSNNSNSISNAWPSTSDNSISANYSARFPSSPIPPSASSLSDTTPNKKLVVKISLNKLSASKK
jgi:hypothetical protein